MRRCSAPGCAHIEPETLKCQKVRSEPYRGSRICSRHPWKCRGTCIAGAHALARGSQDGKRPQGPEREPSPANAQSFGGHASHARAGSAHAQRPSTTPARHTASAADLLRLWKGIADGDLAAVEEVVGAHPLPGSVGGAAPKPATKAAGSSPGLIKGPLLTITAKKIQQQLQRLPLERVSSVISVDQVCHPQTSIITLTR